MVTQARQRKRRHSRQLALDHELASRGWQFEDSYSVNGHGIARVFFHALLRADGACAVTGLPDLLDRFRTDFLKDTALGGQNVTEWCKKEACWERFRDTMIAIPADVDAGLLSREKAQIGKSTSVLEEQTSEAESEQVERVSSVSSQIWFDLAAWAKDTQSLHAWQRSLAFSLGRLAGNGRKPSRKQALHGEKIIKEAKSLGFNGQGVEMPAKTPKDR